MFCPGCGKILNDNARFCGTCGTPVNNAAAEFVESINSQTEDAVIAQSEILVADIQAPITSDNQAPIVPDKQVPEVYDQQASAEQVAEVYTEQPAIASNEQLPKLFGDPVSEVHKEPEITVPAESADDVPEKKGKRVLKGMLASVYCVLIFMFLAIGSGLLTARFVFSSNNIKSIVNEVDSSMADNLLKEHIAGYDSESNKEVINEVFSESTIPEFIGAKVGAYGDYILGGKKPAEIAYKDIVSLFEENENVAVMFFGFEPGDNRDMRYERYYDVSIKPILEKFYGNEKINNVMGVSRIVLSIWILIGVALIVAALIFVLIRLKLKKGKFLNWLGWTFTVTGALYLVAYVTAVIVRMFLDSTGVGTGTKELIGVVLGSIALEVIIIGGVMLLVGILMLVIKKLMSKKAKNEKTA